MRTPGTAATSARPIFGRVCVLTSDGSVGGALDLRGGLPYLVGRKKGANVRITRVAGCVL